MLETVEVNTRGKLLEVSATGKLTKDFFESFIPAV